MIGTVGGHWDSQTAAPLNALGYTGSQESKGSKSSVCGCVRELAQRMLHTHTHMHARAQDKGEKQTDLFLAATCCHEFATKGLAKKQLDDLRAYSSRKGPKALKKLAEPFFPLTILAQAGGSQLPTEGNVEWMSPFSHQQAMDAAICRNSYPFIRLGAFNTQVTFQAAGVFWVSSCLSPACWLTAARGNREASIRSQR